MSDEILSTRQKADVDASVIHGGEELRFSIDVNNPGASHTPNGSYSAGLSARRMRRAEESARRKATRRRAKRKR